MHFMQLLQTFINSTISYKMGDAIPAPVQNYIIENLQSYNKCLHTFTNYQTHPTRLPGYPGKPITRLNNTDNR